MAFPVNPGATSSAWPWNSGNVSFCSEHLADGSKRGFTSLEDGWSVRRIVCVIRKEISVNRIKVLGIVGGGFGCHGRAFGFRRGAFSRCDVGSWVSPNGFLAAQWAGRYHGGTSRYCGEAFTYGGRAFMYGRRVSAYHGEAFRLCGRVFRYDGEAFRYCGFLSATEFSPQGYSRLPSRSS